MVWYVALVAILNLGLGYALAVYLRAGRRRNSWDDCVADSASFGQFAEDDEYAFDESDEHLIDAREFESARVR
jgi:hypothetical protein